MKNKFPKVVYFLLCFLLIFEQSGFAQIAGQLDISGYFTGLRNVLSQDKFRPLHLRYLAYDNVNNNFKLLLDKGDFGKAQGLSQDGAVPGEKLESSTKELLNYFFIGISLPNDSFWVNLRPDSPDNIIDPYLAQTDVGKILLEADLQLKKDTASFTSPQTREGKEYWDKLYKKSEELFGAESITIPTLTRPWIVPNEIIIRESTDNAYIYKATLKVMLEQDYLKDSKIYNFTDERFKQLNEYASGLIRKNILPKLNKDINTAKRYAPLRQVYYSLILAQWFKQKFSGRSGLYSNLIDKMNLTGLTSKDSWSKAVYFQAYQKSFKEGEYSIKEPVYTIKGQTIRSYMSGGISLGGEAMRGAIRSGVKIAGNPLMPIAVINPKGISGEFLPSGQMQIDPYSGSINIEFENAPQASSPVIEQLPVTQTDINMAKYIIGHINSRPLEPESRYSLNAELEKEPTLPSHIVVRLKENIGDGGEKIGRRVLDLDVRAGGTRLIIGPFNLYNLSDNGLGSQIFGILGQAIKDKIPEVFVGYVTNKETLEKLRIAIIRDGKAEYLDKEDNWKKAEYKAMNRAAEDEILSEVVAQTLWGSLLKRLGFDNFDIRVDLKGRSITGLQALGYIPSPEEMENKPTAILSITATKKSSSSPITTIDVIRDDNQFLPKGRTEILKADLNVCLVVVAMDKDGNRFMAHFLPSGHIQGGLSNPDLVRYYFETHLEKMLQDMPKDNVKVAIISSTKDDSLKGLLAELEKNGPAPYLITLEDIENFLKKRNINVPLEQKDDKEYMKTVTFDQEGNVKIVYLDAKGKDKERIIQLAGVSSASSPVVYSGIRGAVENLPAFSSIQQSTASSPVKKQKLVSSNLNELRAEFNAYLKNEGLDQYGNLKGLFSNETMEILINDRSAKPVFLQVLEKSDTESLQFRDLGPARQLLGYQDIEKVKELISSYSVIGIGSVKLANELAGKDKKVVVGITDRYTSEEFTLIPNYRVANNRRCYIPLPGGLFLSIKGSGQNSYSNRPAYYINDRKGKRVEGAVGIDEISELGNLAGVSLRESGMSMDLGYLPINNKLIGLEGAKEENVALVFSLSLDYHRLSKLPQIIANNGLGFLCERISAVLDAIGELDNLTDKMHIKLSSDRILKPDQLMLIIMLNMGKTEGYKQNNGLYHETLHDQDVDFTGITYDVEELIGTQSPENSGKNKELYLNGISQRVKMLLRMLNNKDTVFLFPNPVQTLRVLFKGYFENLSEEYLNLLENNQNGLAEIFQPLSSQYSQKWFSIFGKNSPEEVSAEFSKLLKEELERRGRDISKGSNLASSPVTELREAVQKLHNKEFNINGGVYVINIEKGNSIWDSRIVLKNKDNLEVGHFDLDTKRDAINNGGMLNVAEGERGRGFAVFILSKLREVFPKGKELITEIVHEESLESLKNNGSINVVPIVQLFNTAGWELIAAGYYDGIGQYHERDFAEQMSVDESNGEGGTVIARFKPKIAQAYLPGFDYLSSASSPLGPDTQVKINEAKLFNSREFGLIRKPGISIDLSQQFSRRHVVIGDIHGDFEGLKQDLRDAGLVDMGGNWIGGDTVLIQMGDMIDRGEQSFETYQYLSELRSKARFQGGDVKMLLGNHENMFFRGMSGDSKQFSDWINNLGSSEFKNILQDTIKNKGIGIARRMILTGESGEFAKWRELYLGFSEDIKKGEIQAAYEESGVLFVHGGITARNKHSVSAKGEADFLNRQLAVKNFDGVRGALWNSFGYEVDGEGVDYLQIVAHTPELREGAQVRVSPNGRVVNVDVGHWKGYGGNRGYAEIKGNRLQAYALVKDEAVSSAADVFFVDKVNRALLENPQYPMRMVEVANPEYGLRNPNEEGLGLHGTDLTKLKNILEKGLGVGQEAKAVFLGVNQKGEPFTRNEAYLSFGNVNSPGKVILVFDVTNVDVLSKWDSGKRIAIGIERINKEAVIGIIANIKDKEEIKDIVGNRRIPVYFFEPKFPGLKSLSSAKLRDVIEKINEIEQENYILSLKVGSMEEQKRIEGERGDRMRELLEQMTPEQLTALSSVSERSSSEKTVSSPLEEIIVLARTVFTRDPQVELNGLFEDYSSQRKRLLNLYDGVAGIAKKIAKMNPGVVLYPASGSDISAAASYADTIVSIDNQDIFTVINNFNLFLDKEEALKEQINSYLEKKLELGFNSSGIRQGFIEYLAELVLLGADLSTFKIADDRFLGDNRVTTVEFSIVYNNGSERKIRHTHIKYVFDGQPLPEDIYGELKKVIGDRADVLLLSKAGADLAGDKKWVEPISNILAPGTTIVSDSVLNIASAKKLGVSGKDVGNLGLSRKNNYGYADKSENLNFYEIPLAASSAIQQPRVEPKEDLGFISISNGEKLFMRKGQEENIVSIAFDNKDGEQIGFVDIMLRESLINYIYIDPRFRSEGYSKIILDTILNKLQDQSFMGREFSFVTLYVQNPLLVGYLLERKFILNPYTPDEQKLMIEVIIPKKEAKEIKNEDSIPLYVKDPAKRDGIRGYVNKMGFRLVEQPIEGETSNVTIYVKYTLYFSDKNSNTQINSASPVYNEGQRTGGIDFRALPIARQPALIKQKVNESFIHSIPLAQLNSEWLQIENMLAAGITPSSERIKEYLQSCCQKQDFKPDIDKILSCIADILRLEEERVSSTDISLKEMLALLESAKPTNEMQLALTQITVEAKEPGLIE
ncbi:MAG: metallophosphoesterase [Candidatus Omnitrophica bacterium]|nr:metallophosphoesterase [Candidatus Omnitrophota bacterium]MDD5690448.1 metallophosphoesterase [Candidatus Omnitrophota bacterium]